MIVRPFGVSLAAAAADEVHRRMTAAGMSQTELARAAGMPPTLLHRCVRGQRDLQLDEIEALAGALGVGAGWLLLSALLNVPPTGDRS
jgi:transcriptional regulator with XRE-family HTH domain